MLLPPSPERPQVQQRNSDGKQHEEDPRDRHELLVLVTAALNGQVAAHVRACLAWRARGRTVRCVRWVCTAVSPRTSYPKASQLHVSKTARETVGRAQYEMKMATQNPCRSAGRKARTLGRWLCRTIACPSSAASRTSSTTSTKTVVAVGHSAFTSRRRLASPMHSGGTTKLGRLSEARRSAESQLVKRDGKWTP